MNTLNDLLQQPFVTRLGWTLIHFLWQGSAIALILSAANIASKRRSAQARYLAGCLALAAMAIAPFITFFAHEDIPMAHISSQVFGATNAVPEGTPIGPARNGNSFLPKFSGGLVSAMLPWLVLAWSVGVCALSLRLLGGWLQVQRLQRLRKRETQEIGEPLLSRLHELKARLEITRPVLLLKSALVEVPTVIGWLRPVIFLPASTLTGLTPAQLESILAHELAHIRRNDYLVNLFQRVVETLLFYHPAVWWVSKCIREEREHCCDDLVVQVCGDRCGYARALASLEDLRSAVGDVVLAATDGFLADRIRRLLGKSPDQKETRWQRIVLVAILAIGLCALAVGVKIASSTRLYASEVRILIRNIVQAGQNPVSQSFNPYFMQTEVERITSTDLLYNVADKLNLPERFARRMGATSHPDIYSVCLILKKNVTVKQSPNSNVLSVTVLDENPDTAMLIADTLVEAYLAQRQNTSWKSTGVLRAEIERQEKELGTLQEQMDKLRTELVIADLDDESFRPAPEAEIIRKFERARAEVALKLVNFESLLNQLTNRPREQLANAIPNLSYPDSRLSELLGLHGAAETTRTQLTEQLGEEHAKVLAVKGTIKALREQIDARVNGLLDQIQLEVNRNRAQLTFLENKIAESRQEEAKVMEKYRPYFAAKREFDQQQRICETLKLRILQETVDSGLAQSSVQILQKASPARAMWRWF